LLLPFQLEGQISESFSLPLEGINFFPARTPAQLVQTTIIRMEIERSQTLMFPASIYAGHVTRT
jgi:hypothetical protein